MMAADTGLALHGSKIVRPRPGIRILVRGNKIGGIPVAMATAAVLQFALHQMWAMRKLGEVPPERIGLSAAPMDEQLTGVTTAFDAVTTEAEAGAVGSN